MTLSLKRLLIILTILLLSACSLSEPEIEEEAAPPKVQASEPKTSRVAVEEGRNRSMLSDVEVLWRVPQDPVDGFIIYYGYDTGHMDRSIRVDLQELSPIQDMQFGEVYRYTLRDVSPARPLVISIAAFRGEEISQPSSVFSVEPSVMR